MPAFEMTAAEESQYGATLSIWQQIALIQAWSPLFTFGQKFIAAADPYAKALVVSEACEWLASKTSSGLDDELVKQLAAVLATPQGEALVRWAIGKVQNLKG